MDFRDKTTGKAKEEAGFTISEKYASNVLVKEQNAPEP